MASLRLICVKSSDQTFLGAGIHAPKNVCHDGGIFGVRETGWVIVTGAGTSASEVAANQVPKEPLGKQTAMAEMCRFALLLMSRNRSVQFAFGA